MGDGEAAVPGPAGVLLCDRALLQPEGVLCERRRPGAGPASDSLQ